MKGRKESGRWSMEDMYNLFPRLRERAEAPAGVMSGGEQQMLTLCRTLMGDPDLIMIDEPTEGLAPKIVDQVANLFDEIAKRGIAVLLEDIHWADDSSLDLIERLIRAVHEDDAPAHLLVLCLSRPILFERRPQWGHDLPGFGIVTVNPLGRVASRALVRRGTR